MNATQMELASSGRLAKDLTTEDAIECLADAVVDGGEFLDWVAAQPNVRLVDLQDATPHLNAEEQKAMLAIFAKREEAAKPKAKGGFEMVDVEEQGTCPLSAEDFVAYAQPIAGEDFFRGVKLIPRKFKSGSYGYTLDRTVDPSTGKARPTKRHLRINGILVSVPINVNAILNGSKPKGSKVSAEDESDE